MSSRLRLGVIGLGAWGTELVRSAVGHADVQVVVAADPSESARTRFAADHPAVTVHARVTDVIDSDVDAVYIAAPPSAHADLAIAALETGKHVFCEKPLAISLADGQRIRAAVERSGAAFGVNFALSDRAAAVEVARALEAGEAGQVRRVDVELAFPTWPREFQALAGWVAGSEQGGFVREVFSHFAYLTDRIIGPLAVEHVSGRRGSGLTATEVSVDALLRGAGDVPVRLTGEAGVALAESYSWTLVGTRRSYRLTDWGTLAMCEPDGEWQVIEPPGPRGSEATRLALFAAATRREPSRNLADVESAWRVQQIVEAIVDRIT